SFVYIIPSHLFLYPPIPPSTSFLFFFHHPATTDIYTLSLHDALPIYFFQIGGIGPKEYEMLECYSTLSYAAALTSKVKLGPLVVGVTYRHPGILVKTATTLDVLSGGQIGRAHV